MRNQSKQIPKESKKRTLRPQAAGEAVLNATNSKRSRAIRPDGTDYDFKDLKKESRALDSLP